MVFLFVDGPMAGHTCSICKHYCGFEGGWLHGGFSGPWLFWVCLDCDDWVDTLPKPKK